MSINEKPNLVTAIKFLLIADLVLSALVATRTTLLLAIGDISIGADSPFTAASLIGTWLATFVAWSLVQALIMLVGTVVSNLLVALFFKNVFLTPNGFTPTSKLIVKIALVIAVFVSAFDAVFLYSFLASRTIHAHEGLNAAVSLLTFVVDTLYATIVITFIGVVATIVFGTLAALVTGKRRA